MLQRQWVISDPGSAGSRTAMKECERCEKMIEAVNAKETEPRSRETRCMHVGTCQAVSQMPERHLVSYAML